MSIHQARELTDQVVLILEADGLTVGRGEKPSTIPANTGYVIVYPLPGGSYDGDIDVPFEESRAPYQLQSIGSSSEQCEWVADEARSALVAGTFTLTGRSVVRVIPTFLGGIQRDDDVQPPVYYSPDRFDIWTAPS